jgi:phage FluMu protein Com
MLAGNVFIVYLPHSNKETHMQIKCSACAIPFALNKEEIATMVAMFKETPSAHYDAHCPKCRKATKISKKQFALNPIYKKMLEE